MFTNKQTYNEKQVNSLNEPGVDGVDGMDDLFGATAFKRGVLMTTFCRVLLGQL